MLRTPERRVRVCVVGPSLDILGGQAIQAARLVERLRDVEGVDVRFLPVNPRLAAPLRHLQRIKYVRTAVTTIAYVTRLIIALPRCDVIHAFSASYFSYLLAPLPAMVLGRLFGRRVLLNYRSGEAEDHLRRSLVAVRTCRLAHEIVVPSGYLVDVFARFGLRAVAVPNFVDLQLLRYRQRHSVAPRFLSNRNLEPMYNVECTIRAFACVQEVFPDAELTIAGDGSERSRLEGLVRDLGLRNVRFTGRIPPVEMLSLYDASDVFLNSPDIDNMPGSIIEAFAAGLVVCTTDAGGIPYVVRNEHNGLLVSRGDFGSLAAAALRILREPGLAERLTRRAYDDVVSMYVWDAVRPGWERLYGVIGVTPSLA